MQKIFLIIVLPFFLVSFDSPSYEYEDNKSLLSPGVTTTSNCVTELDVNEFHCNIETCTTKYYFFGFLYNIVVESTLLCESTTFPGGAE